MKTWSKKSHEKSQTLFLNKFICSLSKKDSYMYNYFSILIQIKKYTTLIKTVFYFCSTLKATFYVSLYYIKCLNLLFALGLVICCVDSLKVPHSDVVL